MEKLFVPYEIALKAKDAGFDEITFAAYNSAVIHDTKELVITDWEKIESNDDILVLRKFNSDKEYLSDLFAAPLYQQLIDWFREKHNLSIELSWSPSYEYDTEKGEAKWSDPIWEITIVRIKQREWDAEGPDFQRMDGKQLTYYSALNVALEYAFELIK